MTTVHTYRYGNDPSQYVNLFLPVGDYLPLVVVIHGGFWRSRYSIDLADPLAMELTRFGVAAAAVEYRRVGNGGGWPTTLADVARAVDQLATQGQQLAEGRLRLDRVAAVGHSAGGQRAANEAVTGMGVGGLFREADAAELRDDLFVERALLRKPEAGGDANAKLDGRFGVVG